MAKDMKRGRPRKYATPEESKAAKLENIKRWQRENKEKVYESIYKYQEAHREEIREYQRKRAKGIYGRAYNLSKGYEQMDKKAGRNESTITPEWIIENIFTSKCYWCGETDWRLLGCDRIDNTKPHTPDNVICSCSKCNKQRNRHSMEYFEKYQISKKLQGVQLTLF